MSKNVAIVVLSVLLLLVLTGYISQWARSNVLQGEIDGQALQIAQLQLATNPHNFNSLQELKAWVDVWRMCNGFVNITIPLSGGECSAFAERMQRDALQDGFLMSVCLIDGSGVVYGVRVSSLAWHAGCLAQAGGAYYWVEPQTGDVVFVAYRGGT